MSVAVTADRKAQIGGACYRGFQNQLQAAAKNTQETPVPQWADPCRYIPSITSVGRPPSLNGNLLPCRGFRLALVGLGAFQVWIADFCSGELALRQGAKDEAVRLFRLAESDCPHSFIECDAATAELRLLGLAR